MIRIILSPFCKERLISGIRNCIRPNNQNSVLNERWVQLPKIGTMCNISGPLGNFYVRVLGKVGYLRLYTPTRTRIFRGFNKNTYHS